MNRYLQEEIRPPVKDRMVIDDPEYQVKETGEIREKIKFAWLPVYLGLPNFIPLKGCKFTWLRKVKITEKQQLYRTLEFDDGWLYEFYWSRWKEEWIIINLERI